MLIWCCSKVEDDLSQTAKKTERMGVEIPPALPNKLMRGGAERLVMSSIMAVEREKEI